MNIALGLGCDRDTPATTIQQAIEQALTLAGARLADVRAVASIDLKADEPGLLALAAQHGWTLTFYTPAQLAAVQCQLQVVNAQMLAAPHVTEQYSGTW